MIQSHQVCCEVKGSVKSTLFKGLKSKRKCHQMQLICTGVVWNIIKCLSPELGTHTLLTSIVDGCYEVKTFYFSLLFSHKSGAQKLRSVLNSVQIGSRTI